MPSLWVGVSGTTEGAPDPPKRTVALRGRARRGAPAPALDTIDLLAGTGDPHGTALTVEPWGTGRPENAVPVDHLATATVHVAAPGPHRATVRFGYRPPYPCNADVILYRINLA